LPVIKRKTRLSAAFSKLILEYRSPLLRADLAVWIEAKLRSAALGVSFGFTPALLIWCLKRAQAPHFIEDAFRVQLAFQPFERAIHWFAFSNNDFWHQFTSIPKNSPIPTLGERNLLRPSTPRQMVLGIAPQGRPGREFNRHACLRSNLTSRLARGCRLGLFGSDFALETRLAAAAGAGPP
jgi:hypothetical protein